MKSIDQNNIGHEFNGESLESVMVTDGSGQALPGVIIIPTVMGVTDLEIGFARERVGCGGVRHLLRRSDHDWYLGTHMLAQPLLQILAQCRFALRTGEQQIPAGDEGPRGAEAKPLSNRLEVGHQQLTTADIHRPQ